jgi:glucokinase
MTAQATAGAEAGVTAIGVDVGGTRLRVARISADGRILAKHAGPVERDRDAFVPRLIEMIGRVMAEDVAAIGIGLPGRVDARRAAVHSAGYLDIAGLPIAQTLQARLGLPIAIDNDCGMALVAEMSVGAAQGCRDVVMFTIGTGIGGAVATYGDLMRGRSFAGQLGHVTVDTMGEACACGRRGCVETTSSGTALGRLVATAGLPSGTTADALLAAAQAGQSSARAILARAILEAWATPLRSAIGSMVAVADPEVVLLGGGLGAAACAALAYAPEASAWYQCPVRPATLGDDAGVIGAALYALGQMRTGAVGSQSSAA